MFLSPVKMRKETNYSHYFDAVFLRVGVYEDVEWAEAVQEVYPPYSMSRYSFAVLFLMSNYSDRNKKKVFLGGSREW